MFKYILTIALSLAVLFWSGASVWSEDMEDHFLGNELEPSKSIFIDVKDVSLENVLKIFSQQSGLSFIASSDVADKKITVYLNKIPLDQALQTVLDANGLQYVLQGDSNVFFVTAKPKEEKTDQKAVVVKITRVYQLKYATVSTSKLNSTISISSSSGALTGDLEDAVKNALSPDGKVLEDTRTNSLIITDVPSQFDIIESTISKLDVPIPQVLIEVEMIDVSKSTADQIGITYGATPLTFTGGTKSTNWPFGGASGSGSTSSSSTSSTTSSTSGSGGWNIPGSGVSMTAALNFLTTNTDAKTLARPRILTLNNQTAQIEISTDQAISVSSQSTSTSGSTATTTSTPERATTGVILKVTPQANLLTREITMAVSPKVVDVILSQVQTSNTGPQNFDTVTRESDSVLRLKDGQSMVIGGLMTTEDDKTIIKLPFLGDLPLVGGAFRSKSTKKSERELIIFLTPHIIDDLSQSAPANNSSDRDEEINSTLNSYEMKKD